MIVRGSKAVLILSFGIFSLLVGFDNIIDGSNFAFVQHVMSMDTTFPGNTLMWRSVTAEWAHRSTYALIIASELAVGVACVAGAGRIFGTRLRPVSEFERAKALAIGGLAAGFFLYFFVFLVIGGEWFQMWQSTTWNGQESAFRFAALFALALIFVAMKDGDPRS